MGSGIGILTSGEHDLAGLPQEAQHCGTSQSNGSKQPMISARAWAGTCQKCTTGRSSSQFDHGNMDFMTPWHLGHYLAITYFYTFQTRLQRFWEPLLDIGQH